jgi:hypothetical protein
MSGCLFITLIHIELYGNSSTRVACVHIRAKTRLRNQKFTLPPLGHIVAFGSPLALKTSVDTLVGVSNQRMSDLTPIILPTVTLDNLYDREDLPTKFYPRRGPNILL